MATKNGFPYAEIEYDAKGKTSAASVKGVIDTVGGNGVTDVLFLAHGWNNDIKDARKWYNDFLGFLREEVDSKRVPGVAARKLAVVAVFWPSKKFADSELVAGNASAVGTDVTMASLKKQLALLTSAFTDKASKAKFAAAEKLLPKLSDDPAAQRKFIDLLRTFWSTGKVGADGLPKSADKTPGDKILKQLAPPVLDLPTGQGAGSSGGGGAAGIGSITMPGGGAGGSAANIFGSILNGARNALNLTTYYTMKERAGVVAENGVAPLVRRVREACPAVKVHLAGHSFGGRLVTAVANALPKGAAHRLHSLFLMQAAFSHYGMAQKYDGTSNGLFRAVVSDKKISGPIYITYTAKDKAVGLAYPLASRLGGQVASGLGDENDTYGGMGRNGAQKTPEVTPHQLLAANQQYVFTPGGVYNLDANGVITSHSDICRIEVAHALASAIAST